MNQKENTKQIARTIIFAGIVLLMVLNFTQVVQIAKNLYGVISPLLLGAVIAFILNILMNEYEKRFFSNCKNEKILSIRRGICILLSILTIILVLLFFLGVVIPKMTEFIGLLAAGFPAMYDKVVTWIIQHGDEFPPLQQKLQELNMDGEAALQKGLQILGNWAFGTLSLIGTVFSGMVKLILAVTFSIYILFDKEDLKRKFDKLFRAFIKEDRREKLYVTLNTANDTFSSYILGQGKDAIILGLLCTIGMFIFRLPYATVIGPVIGVTALIPMVGAYIGAIFGFLLIIMVDKLKALVFIMFIIVLQQIEGNVIYPKVVGQSIGLPGIWVFAAITVGGGLMGITGVLLGVPIAATAYKLLGKSINEREKKVG
jgi:predicted PurR-regulated permease PerM